MPGIQKYLSRPAQRRLQAFCANRRAFWSLIIFVSVFCLTLLAIGLSYAYAALNLYFRDLERIMGVLMMAWLFVSPVFIPISNVPERYLWIYDANPMGGILMTWRDIFWAPGFHPERFLVLLPICLVVFFVGRWLFRRLEPQFAEMM